MRHELPPHEFDWSKVFEPNSDLNRFRLALHAGNTVAEARAISAAKAPQDGFHIATLSDGESFCVRYILAKGKLRGVIEPKRIEIE